MTTLIAFFSGMSTRGFRAFMAAIFGAGTVILVVVIVVLERRFRREKSAGNRTEGR